jgi:hypothetical protein
MGSRGGELMCRAAALATVLMLVIAAVPAAGQQRPRTFPGVVQERYRVSIDFGQQATENPLSERRSFDQYFEQGSFTFDRRIARALFYDVGASVRVWRSLYAGATISIFENSGNGNLTARVPHPLHFNRPRTVEGTVSGIERREVGQHFGVGWMVPVTGELDLVAFGGPSVFTTQQIFVTTLMLSLDKEVFPFDSLAFPGAQTETRRENVVGYHLGADVTWKLARHVGLGALVRYASGKGDFAPTGSQAVSVEVGGLHAGGGLRVSF